MRDDLNKYLSRCQAFCHCALPKVWRHSCHYLPHSSCLVPSTHPPTYHNSLNKTHKVTASSTESISTHYSIRTAGMKFSSTLLPLLCAPLASSNPLSLFGS